MGRVWDKTDKEVNSIITQELIDNNGLAINIIRPVNNESYHKLAILGYIVSEKQLNHAEIYLNNVLIKYIPLHGKTEHIFRYKWWSAIGDHDMSIYVTTKYMNTSTKEASFKIVSRKR